MSEAELHILRARLQGGKDSKARRGELKMILPIGLVYDPQGHVVLDPDQHVQQALRTLFQTFQRTGSAEAVVRFFRKQRLLFPYRVHCGARKGEVVDVLCDYLGLELVKKKSKKVKKCPCKQQKIVKEMLQGR